MINKNVKIFSNPIETAHEFADYLLERVSKATTFTVASQEAQLQNYCLIIWQRITLNLIYGKK